MTKQIEVKVPELGDFSNVPVIEILVKPGDLVTAEQSLLTLESEKSTMEIPSPVAGKVRELMVALGDEVSSGQVVLSLEADASLTKKDSAASPLEQTVSAAAETPAVAQNSQPPSQADVQEGQHLVVIGGGPGGYSAAFRAADLGMQVTLIERYSTLGGVCLNVGCIPSKALLHAAQVVGEAADMAKHGISFSKPKIDLDKLRGWKDGIVGRLTGGLATMAKQRKVIIMQGEASFLSANELSVKGADGEQVLGFDQAIIAVGSSVIKLPGLPWDDPRLMDSTDALLLEDVPQQLLIVGGGIIGLEMATVYHALGSKVTVVEFMDQLIPGADKDLVRPLARRIGARYQDICLGTKVVAIAAKKDGLHCKFEGKKMPSQSRYDRVLVAVGRSPNGLLIGADKAGVEVDDRGFIAADSQQRTNVAHIFAIGDVVGQPMLAHKATHEAHVAAEVAAGEKTEMIAQVIPSVAYTDPEVAWVGMTENQAKADARNYGVGQFPWAASGRALGLDRTEGFTKLLFDKDTGRLIGAGITGPGAGDLIAECTLAIEMGCDAQDIALTIHPHPTLAESVAMAAEVFEGTITDLYLPKNKR